MEQKKTTGLETSPSDGTGPLPVRWELGLSLGEYQRLAMRTAKDFGSRRENLIHAALGVTSDAGEFADVIKAHAIYGKDLDREHALEELGDVLWFVALGARELGTDLEEVARRNVEKLRVRYPNKYSDADAIARVDKKGG